MRRVDEFSPALVGFLANPSGQSFFQVEEALLVMLNVHDVFPHDAANAAARLQGRVIHPLIPSNQLVRRYRIGYER
jgi:hypothetical protein